MLKGDTIAVFVTLKCCWDLVKCKPGYAVRYPESGMAMRCTTSGSLRIENKRY